MVQNPGRWLLLSIGLIGLSLLLVFTKGISFGSDLKGGTRLVYSIPFDEARSTGQLPSEESKDQLLAKTIDVMNKRVDGLGLREINLSGQGDEQIVMELPGLSEAEIENIKETVTSLGKLEFRIVANDSDGIDLTRERKKLNDYFETAEVKRRLDAWKDKEAAKALTSPRDLSVWIETLRAFQSVTGSTGPVKGVRWFAVEEPKERAFATTDARKENPNFLPMRVEEALDPKGGARFVFRGEDLNLVAPQKDKRGNNAVFFRFAGEKRTAFTDFTEKFTGRSMAIVLNELVNTSPTINDVLPGEGIIESNKLGGFTPEETRNLITVLQTGSLRVKPRLESESRIGSAIGEDSIRLGILSSGLALLVTFLFMLVYYRLSGTIAAVSLVVNGVILLGVLSLYHATLTLPGIAGFILTLAMAVDSNILIYERIREELDRGRGIEQAVRLGFERAFVTIVDSNLTTLLTSLVLYKIGTGPIKGLGITLSIGILTTLFAALVFTKAVFAILLERKALPEIRMMRLFKQTPNLNFISIWKWTVAISVITSIAGLVAFFAAPEKVFGIDFVGGATARVRLERPVELQEMRALVNGKVAGFDSVDPTPARNDFSEVAGQPGYREYLVKGKLSREQRRGPNSEGDALANDVERFRSGLRAALAGRVIPDGVADLKLEKGAGGGAQPTTFQLHFSKPVSLDRVKETLATGAAGLTGLEVNPATAGATEGTAFQVKCAAPATSDADAVRDAVVKAFSPVRDVMPLSDPFPEANTILPRVAKSLRNSAILSLIVAFVLIVLYVRFRFQEYRYGIGGVVGIIHDLIVTLGVVALANMSGLVDVEIDMTMIAVFLTIAGYSINDTIVIYDRIRENLEAPDSERMSMEKVVDESCNQTLSRTLLTSTAAFLSSLLMFALNYGKHNPLEGFGFTMMVGIASGTYSSIWVASLFVVGVERWVQRNKKGGGGSTTAKPAELVPV